VVLNLEISTWHRSLVCLIFGFRNSSLGVGCAVVGRARERWPHALRIESPRLFQGIPGWLKWGEGGNLGAPSGTEPLERCTGPLESPLRRSIQKDPPVRMQYGWAADGCARAAAALLALYTG
jgi:hypothetical protein